MYPTAIIVLVEMEKSIWDTEEVAREVTTIRFISNPIPHRRDDLETGETALPEVYQTPYNSVEGSAKQSRVEPRKERENELQSTSHPGNGA